MKELGTFRVKCGTVTVSDPCYGPGSDAAGVVPAKSGVWHAYVEIYKDASWGPRPSELIAVHDTELGNKPDELDWELLPYDFCVDSGKLGFFDTSEYVVQKTENDDEFYDDMVGENISNHTVGNFGVVSMSGYGDGSYEGFQIIKNGEAVALKVVFLSDDEEEEVNDEDESVEESWDYEW